jgi:hypothetical protein
MSKNDPIESRSLKWMDWSELVELNAIARDSNFSGKRSQDWLDREVNPSDRFILRPVLWEDFPSRCLRCSVVFTNEQYGLGQLLLDISVEDFEQLKSVNDNEVRGLALHLIDRVKILKPT